MLIKRGHRDCRLTVRFPSFEFSSILELDFLIDQVSLHLCHKVFVCTGIACEEIWPLCMQFDLRETLNEVFSLNLFQSKLHVSQIPLLPFKFLVHICLSLFLLTANYIFQF